MELPFFSALEFKPRLSNPRGSLQARAKYANGVEVSVTIGSTTLCDDMRAPYELCFLWTPDYQMRDEPVFNLTADDVDKLIAEAVALPPKESSFNA
jgi:hypothetical protein